MGMAPSRVQHLRRGAAACSGIHATGRCATTAIAVTYEPHNDPACQVAAGQLKSWMDLWPTMDSPMQIRIARAWTATLAELSQARSIWPNVKGPMGATIATAIGLGWNPVGPSRWVTSQGQTVNLDAAASAGTILSQARGDVLAKVWLDASRSHLGSGAHRGVDLTVYRQHCKALQGTTTAGKQPLLDCVVCAGI